MENEDYISAAHEELHQEYLQGWMTKAEYIRALEFLDDEMGDDYNAFDFQAD